MDENSTTLQQQQQPQQQQQQQPTRMTTRGVANRMQYAESPASSGAAMDSSVVSLQASKILLNVKCAGVKFEFCSDEHDEQQSEYHMDTSGDSLFRTPSMTMRARKRRPTLEDATNIGTPDSNASGSPVGFQQSIQESSFWNALKAKRGRPRAATGGNWRGGGRGGGSARRAGQTSQEAADESSLFSMVKAGKNLNVQYERHQDNALVQLQQFFISCCGCKGIISSVMIQTMEYRFVLLVNKCKASYIFDQRLMDGVIQLLTGLADSQVRAFRHTATFAGK
ncbi:unnamed protein product [Anisakis simplex]|uniref:STAG domain-containing protein n=1 Tax=Anisakis simplex TaxID=6269 RepID=A0A0M3KGK2_ANISI|nr:unnamed protein product [Anisakis simplex]